MALISSLVKRSDASYRTIIAGKLARLMPDGVQQVRLAEPDTAVDEERVVRARWQLGDGLGCGLSELIRRPDNERVEHVPGVQPFDATDARRPTLRYGGFLASAARCARSPSTCG